MTQPLNQLQENPMSDSSTVSRRLRVAILDDYQDAVRHLDCFTTLAGHEVTVHTDKLPDPEKLAQRLKDAEVLIPVRERSVIDEAFLERLPNLKLISQTGKGVAHIDVAACTRLGIAVAASGGNSYAPAELTWALTLAAMRHLPQEINSARNGHWQSAPVGTCLRGRTLGIFGYGGIGKIVAGYGKAFGMRVVAWGREGSQARARQDGVEVATSKEAFFQQSDVLSLHLRLSADTHGIVTAADLAQMKPTAVLVNTSRAGLVEPGALYDALKQGRPGFAAVDAYEEEPVAHHPLFDLPNAICAPHLGYVEKDTYEIFFGGAFDNVLAFEAGSTMGLVNPEVFAQRRR
jgi:D-3-phosphoglycerate dehydrogenase